MSSSSVSPTAAAAAAASDTTAMDISEKIGYKENDDSDWEEEEEEMKSGHEDDEPLISFRDHKAFGSVKFDRFPRELNYDHAFTTPLIQIFSVSIFTELGDKAEPCQIYGLIQAVEWQNDISFELYDRGPEGAEMVVSKHDTFLSLIGPADSAILPSMCTTLDLCLKDKTRDIEVVKGRVNLDPESEHCYDRLIKKDVQGDHGIASIYYVVFQCAVTATLQLTATTPFLNPKEEDPIIRVCGSIFAGYGGNNGKYCDEDKFKYLETQVFDVPLNEPLCVESGDPIKLSRDVVAVPAYSPLAIDLDMMVCGTPFQAGPVHFSRLHCTETTLTFNPCGDLYVTLQVSWNTHNTHAFSRFYGDPIVASTDNEIQKKARVFHSPPPLSASVSRSRTPVYYGSNTLLEVFTVHVGGMNQKVSALCGNIYITDGTEKVFLYRKDKTSPEFLPDNRFASLEGPYRALDNTDFSISLNLKDPVNGLEVSRGRFSWHTGLLQVGRWFNKRTCTVVGGKHGYAAVHYVIFNKATPALVKIKFFNKGGGDLPVNVYGSLVTEYSNCEYLTTYDLKYFRSRLFDRQSDRSIELKTGSKIRLSKYVVAVPDGSSLIIKADLSVVGNADNSDGGSIYGTAEFKMDRFRTVRNIIRGGPYEIEISVKYL